MSYIPGFVPLKIKIFEKFRISHVCNYTNLKKLTGFNNTTSIRNSTCKIAGNVQLLQIYDCRYDTHICQHRWRYVQQLLPEFFFISSFNLSISNISSILSSILSF